MTTLAVVTAVSALLVVAAGLLGFVGLRRQVIAPVARLARETRRVAAGDIGHAVVGGGPAELDDLARDVEGMRERLVLELDDARRARAEADRTSASLARSNADLEQFAYVASHDLQEPLRKVSNFCQLLERQYGDQLDDRARQYIGFAVDGAKRMQVLINDLLAFSRVGRTTERFVPVDTAAALGVALDNLSDALVHAAGTVECTTSLPTVPGDPTLLATLFQNLVGNAVKYRGDDPPRVTVAATRRAVGTTGAHEWLFAVQDNGIGIDPRYAERIFVLFQRLHLRDAYGGTGIGLALCKKIVEYHGGTIWLDPDGGPGSRFCFTLPEEAST